MRCFGKQPKDLSLIAPSGKALYELPRLRKRQKPKPSTARVKHSLARRGVRLSWRQLLS
jgi:hypothetical protein